MIIKEGLHSAQKRPPKNIPTCGDFTWTMEEYEQIVNGPVASLGAVPQTDGKNIFSLKANSFVFKYIANSKNITYAPFLLVVLYFCCDFYS